MAWMFAGVENDMSVGMHLHYHFVPPLMPPTPFYPHPAIGIARDKFASKTKVNNKKAARTGTKFKILMPPHLPLLGPLTHGSGKEGTGIQTGWMGAGIGAHPFGGAGFVVIEGKPALGFMSNLLGCWCVAPGTDMMLPFVGMDFLMVPTHAPTVLYGPAPLAMDLFVLLLALVEALLDWLIGKIKIPILQEIAEVARDAVLEGMETAMVAYEQGERPISACLAKGAKSAGYAFVDGMVEFAAEKVTGPLGDVPIVGDKVQDWAQGKIVDASNDAIGEHVLGKDYNKYLEDREAQQDAQAATPGGVFGAIDDLGAGFGEAANKRANDKHQDAIDNRDPNAKPATDKEKEAAKKEGQDHAMGGLDDAANDFVEGKAKDAVLDPIFDEGDDEPAAKPKNDDPVGEINIPQAPNVGGGGGQQGGGGGAAQPNQGQQDPGPQGGGAEAPNNVAQQPEQQPDPGQQEPEQPQEPEKAEEEKEEDDPKELNPHVLAMIAAYNGKHGGKGYWWPDKEGDVDGHPGSKAATSNRWKGNIETVKYLGKTLSRDGINNHGSDLSNIFGGKSYCSGITYEIFFKSLERFCQATGKDFSSFKIGTLSHNEAYGETGNRFQTSWNNRGNAEAIVGCGAGKYVQPGEAKAGDFAQMQRTNGSGHSVIVIEMLPGNQIKYWSTQPGTNGVGENTEGYQSILIARVDKLPG